MILLAAVSSQVLLLANAFQTSIIPPSTSTIVPPRAFLPSRGQVVLQMSSFAADGSEYSSKDSDYEDEDIMAASNMAAAAASASTEEDSIPTVELGPVPMSKNSGNRFVAVVYDHDLDTKDRDVLDLHDDRDTLIEDHVMFCRKRNLYNETFNTDSNVDILWSMQT